MFSYSNNGITVASIIDDRRATIEGLYPIKIRVTYSRVRKYYSTGKNLSKDDWERLAETKSKALIAMRVDIQNTFSKIRDVVQELEFREGFSFDTLNQRLSKGISDTLNTAFNNKILNLISNGQIGSSQYYKITLKSIEAFAGTKILFSSITVDWLKRYEKHLLDLNRSYTTVGMYGRAIRCIINEALKAGIIKENQYPFGNGKYEIPTGEGRKIALTLQQIKKIVFYSDGNPTTERYRDLWLFSYLCNGINFADMLRLKYSNIVNGEICFIRQKTIRTTKTKKELRAIVTPEIQIIIDKWGNPDRKPDSYLFPYLNDKTDITEKVTTIGEVVRRCNKRMKIIGKALDIGSISTYTARHSYATILKRSGANIAYISESLGHNDLKTTENYLASFEREEREKNAKLLMDFGGE
ncbi:integrase [Bacteroidia bacterium]|nr:integrase [Bacteroidia bacterium]